VIDYRWRVQVTHHLVDERTGEPYRWVLGCWSEESARECAARVVAIHPGVRVEVLR
jgi:hypothetical protein